MKNNLLKILMAGGILMFSCQEQDFTRDSEVRPKTDELELATSGKGCQFADAAITSITIDYSKLPQVLRPGTFAAIDFSFVTTNLGEMPISLNNHLFQTYLSTELPTSPVGVSTGGAIYIMPGRPDEVLTQGRGAVRTWNINSAGDYDLYEFKYLIIEFKNKNGVSLLECSTSNNYLVQYIDVPRIHDRYEPTCGLADLAVSTIDIDYSRLPLTPVKPGMTLDLHYKFAVSNLGGTPVPLKQSGFSTTLSQDAIYGNEDDITGGGSIFTFPGQPDSFLGQGETIARRWYKKNTDLYKYRYLFVKTSSDVGAGIQECNLDNNIMMKYIDVPRQAGNF